MPKTWNKEWLWGDKSRVAYAAGISPQYLCDILANRKSCSSELATILSTVCRKYGYIIHRRQWAFPDLRHGNPLFDHSEGDEECNQSN